MRQFKSPREELDYLTYKDLSSRAARASTPKAPEPKPEIHVHVDMPEVKEEPKECAPQSPRRWKFKHKYDQYNKLIETIATAE